MQTSSRRRWPYGFELARWSADDRTYAALLDALTRDRLSAEAVDAELHATARRSVADVQTAQQRHAREELNEAHRELRAFRDALLDARARSGPDGSETVAFDSRVPTQDQHADLLIQYLVRPGYAEVRTDEPEPSHYIYRIRVDWRRLRGLAAEQGHPLPD